MDRTARPGPGTRALLVLRLVVAAALLVSAYLHVVLATGPTTSGGQLTLAALFRAQAVVAVLVAAWLLLRPSRTAWLAAAAVGLGSLVAVTVSTYVQLPAVGPFPSLYEPEWYPSKLLAAATAGAAGAGALAGLLRAGRSTGRSAVR